jgi:predicted nucleic acid-binding Zn ribbon protein
VMEPLGADVRRELSRFGPAAGMSDLVTAWPAAVGDGIARNAWPARLSRDGTLHVATRSSAWAFELAQLEPQLLDRVRAEVGEVAPKRLRFAVGRLPEASPEPKATPKQRGIEPSDADREAARLLAAEIADEELREAVAEAVAHGLARSGSGRGL